MNIDLKLLGENLRQLRISSNMSQEEMSEAAGVSRNMYIRYESGLSCPPVDKLVLLAGRLDVPVSLLLTCSVRSMLFLSSDCSISDMVKQYLSLTYMSKKIVMHEIMLLQELENVIYKG